MGIALEIWLCDSETFNPADMSTQELISFIHETGEFMDSIPINSLGHAQFRAALSFLDLERLIERSPLTEEADALPMAGYLALPEIEAAREKLTSIEVPDEGLDALADAMSRALDSRAHIAAVIT